MRFGTFFCATAVTLLAGCAQLPAGGPSTREIVSVAATDRYELVTVTDAVVQGLRNRRDDTFAGGFGSRGGGASQEIGIGDTVRVTIWEAANGGLFSGEAGQLGGGSKSTSIPDQPVGQNGSISIPYAGSIRAAGQTPEAVKQSIETALAGKAIEPQVLVTVVESVYNTATVTGSVTSGGRVPLSGAGDRLLDVVANAGGVSAPVHEVFVQLARGKRTVRVPMQRIVDDPSENIVVRPGDTITLIHEPQTFTALGATGANADVKFSAVGLTLAEALGKVGGLLDNRADPSGVFVLRTEPREIVQAIAPGSRLLQTGAQEIPVVYQLNLREADGLFLAREFRVFNKDIVYVTDAQLNQLQKFLLLVNSVVTPARTGISIANTLD
jgi:polysaccharide export outer membrane protein